MSETAVCSFVLRFVHNQEEDETIPWFGVVRHVQTSSEIRFTDMADALAFINNHLLAKPPFDHQGERMGESEPPH